MSTSTEPIRLTSDYHKGVMARTIPGAVYDRDRKAWVVAADALTPRSASVILKLFPETILQRPELAQIRDQAIQDVRPFDNATEAGITIGADLIREILAAEGKSLYEFQELDLGYLAEVLKAHGGAYLGWERGLGKTIGALALAEELNANSVLIVAPNTAKATVWEPEVKKFLPAHQVIVLPNEKAKRERALGHLRQLREYGYQHVLIVHYEALAIIAGESGKGWKKLGEWDLMIADEAHRIKNPKAKMSRAIKKVPAKMKVALSGTIISNHAEELFSPLQWLFPERYRSKWRDWNDRFLDYVDGGYSKVFVGIKLERLDELRDELGRFMTYRRKEDELDLPIRTDQELFVELAPGQRKVYDQLRDECLARLDDGTVITAEEGVVMLGRLRQVATGLDMFSEDVVSDSSKLDITVEMIEDNEDEQFAVFTWFKPAGRALSDRLTGNGISNLVIDGDVKQADRPALVRSFQNGEVKVLIGTIATMGESLNLQCANNAIFLDRSWSPGDNQQAEDRIYRIGQDKPVTITHLIAKDTVDEYRVMPTIQNKDALRAMILGGNNNAS